MGGRIATSFRLLQEELKRLKSICHEALIIVSRGTAVVCLLRFWSNDRGAKSYVKTPAVVDATLLNQLIETRKLVGEVSDRLVSLDSEVENIGSQLNVVFLTSST